MPDVLAGPSTPYAIAKMDMITHDMEGQVVIGDTLRSPSS